jgi:hypothetical protein
LISYVAFYVGPIQTGFLRGFRKSYGRTGIMIPVKKTPQEQKKTGIWRIPAGIGNLAYAYGQHINVLKHFVYVKYGCRKQF